MALLDGVGGSLGNKTKISLVSDLELESYIRKGLDSALGWTFLARHPSRPREKRTKIENQSMARRTIRQRLSDVDRVEAGVINIKLTLVYGFLPPGVQCFMLQ